MRELEQELEWAREDKGGEAELLREELAEAKKKAHAAQTQRAAEVERLEERCRALEQQNSQQGQSLVSLRGDVAKITDSERAKRDDLEKEIARLTESASKLQKKCDDTEKRREDVAAELSEALASGGGGGGGGEDAEQYKREAASAKKKLDAVVERYNTMKKKAKASLDEAKAEIASLKSKPAPKDDSEALEQAQSKLKAVVERYNELKKKSQTAIKDLKASHAAALKEAASSNASSEEPVSYTHLTLPTKA